MEKLVIKGPARLSGSIQAGRSKNCALPVLFSTLLSEGSHQIRSVPRLQDMESTLKMLLHLGCDVTQAHRGCGSDWTINASAISNKEAPYDLVRKMRASYLCLGPLLARFGEARVSLPGGCAIGARPVDLHLFALEKLGAKVVQDAGYIKGTASRLKGAKIVFPVVSVGATENALMAAVLAKGTTVLENVAREPEVQDLCKALQTMGAEIEGIGEMALTIHGKESLKPMNFEIPPDRIEVATYLIAAHLTQGEIFIQQARADDLTFVLECLEKSGAAVTVSSEGIALAAQNGIRPVDIETAPYLAFPTDLQAQWMALMTQAKGSSVVVENIFENRFMHVPELIRMGAKLSISGSSVAVTGASQLQGVPVMATDLRASASLVLAALVAKGETHVKRIYHLDRGYEAMEQKLCQLGADVERVMDS